MKITLKRRVLAGLTVIVSVIFLSVIASFAETINYSYDKMGRLIKAGYGDGTVVEYTYDKMGNRLQKVTTTTSTTPPKVTMGSITNVTATSAKLSGTVNAGGLSTTAWFEGSTTSGSYAKKSKKKTISGSADVAGGFTIYGLSPGTTYYYRLAAQNDAGASYGDEVKFTTLSK